MDDTELMFNGYVVPATILTLLLLLIFCSSGFCAVDVGKIIHLESSGNPRAVNGSHVGLMQIGREVLTDYNKKHKTAYTQKNLYNGELNRQIGTWYINTEIVRLLKHYKRPVTLENQITAWRFGIGSVLQGKKADRYIKAYKKL